MIVDPCCKACWKANRRTRDSPVAMTEYKQNNNGQTNEDGEHGECTWRAIYYTISYRVLYCKVTKIHKLQTPEKYKGDFKLIIICTAY